MNFFEGQVVARRRTVLMSCEQAPRRVQLERLRTSTAPGVMAETQRAMLALGHMQDAHRLPTASLAVRTLRGLSAADYHRFRENVEALIAADHAVNLFEFALQRMIFRHLAPTFNPHSHRPQTVRYHALEPLLPACRDLLSGLARAGTYDGLDQEQAYRHAMAMLIGDREFPRDPHAARDPRQLQCIRVRVAGKRVG